VSVPSDSINAANFFTNRILAFGKFNLYEHFVLLRINRSTGTQSLIRNSENRKAPKTESVFMEVDSNLNTTVTMTTMTTLMYPLLQDPQARCTVPLLRVYVQVYSSV
jgi:hypothetical protein